MKTVYALIHYREYYPEPNNIVSGFFTSHSKALKFKDEYRDGLNDFEKSLLIPEDDGFTSAFLDIIMIERQKQTKLKGKLND